ncbi:MAG: hypothetical protein KBG15_08265 [Kofleriaceae bacterium]|nr:hypothetical protein [Kofleriaceae bacterium]
MAAKTITAPGRAHAYLLAWSLCLLVAMVALFCAWCEPVWSDGWYQLAIQHEHPLSLGALGRVATHNYFHGNPRSGELLTYILYGVGPLHIVLSTMISVAVIWALTTIGLARQPRRHDALYVTTLLAVLLIAVPRVGPMFFFRPYHANYVAGLLPALLLLAMCRCYLAGTLLRRPWQLPVAIMLALVAGMGNEHTGPAVFATLVGTGILALRQHRLPRWLVAATVAFACSYLALLLAPGQMQRYAGAAQPGLLAALQARSVGAAVVVAALAPGLALWMLPWAWLAIRDYRRNVTVATGSDRPASKSTAPWLAHAVGVAGLFAVAVGLTLLASPSHKPRLYFASTALLACTAVAWITVGRSLAARQWMWRLNAAVIIISCAGLGYTSNVVRTEYRARTAAIIAAPRGSTLVVPPLSPVFWQWSLYDDLRNPSLCAFVAQQRGLAGLTLSDAK